jgi:hypothetical protein
MDENKLTGKILGATPANYGVTQGGLLAPNLQN